MVLPVIIYGASKLRERTFDIDLGVDFKTIAGNMSQTLKKTGGIGLAGPQVSVAKNVAKQIKPVGKDFTQVNQRFTIDIFFSPGFKSWLLFHSYPVLALLGERAAKHIGKLNLNNMFPYRQPGGNSRSPQMVTEYRV